MIKLEKINRAEVLRYLGGSKVELNEAMSGLLKSCEDKILSVSAPKYLYKTVPLNDSVLIKGESIQTHLKGCENAVLLCATVGAEVDRLIRRFSVEDMARAVVIDAMASAAVEQVCDKLEEIIAEENSEKYLTRRFSPGYGDYPIELQKTFLRLLDAPRKIGLCVNESSLLTPTKSVTAIIGISDKPVDKKRAGCISCNLRETCKFRKTGEFCEF